MIEATPPPVKQMPSLMRRLLSAVYARLAYYLGAWRFVYGLRALFGRKPLLAVFTFHRITPNGSEEKHLVTYDKGTPQWLFEEQIARIKKFYQPISLDEFIEVVTGQRALATNSALITFDDADSEFVGQALPVLLKHGCTGVVFAPTDFIETTKRFWHLRVSNAFHRLDEKSWPAVKALSREFQEDKKNWLDGLDIRKQEDLAAACWRFNIALDRMTEEEIEVIVQLLEGVTGTEYELGIRTMSWEQLKQVLHSGIAIESHSASHRKLARLSPQEIATELSVSKSMLDGKLGCSVASICYPAGSFNEDVAKLAAEAGYKVGFTTRFGFIDFPIDDIGLMTLTRFDVRGGNKYEVERFLGELPLRKLRKSWPLK